MKPASTEPSGRGGRRHVEAGADCVAISDVGLFRENNEDAFLIAPDTGFLALADGMGGHAAGEVASALAIDAAYSLWAAIEPSARSHPAGHLERAVAAAHKAVRDHGVRHRERLGMGTTLMLAAVGEDRLTVAHVGDCRAYLLHDGVLSRLTNDHTIGGRLLAAGLIGEAQARCHPRRNVLERTIGGADEAIPEIVEATLGSGDRLLLCSDGLWDELSDGVIASLLGADGPAAAIGAGLVESALAAGGADNVTAVVYRRHPGLENRVVGQTSLARREARRRRR